MNRRAQGRVRSSCVSQHLPFIHEVRIKRPDGTECWIGCRGQTEYDASGRAVRHFGVVQDITERKRAEELFDFALEAAPTAMLIVDQQGTILFASALTERLLGYTRREILWIERLVP